MKKILASDYDNTFYINDQDIYRNIENVNKFRKKGNIFIMATGRSYKDFNEKLLEYPIKYDYLIINQGATILDNQGNIIKNYPISEEVKKELIFKMNLNDGDNMFSCSKLDSRVSIKSNNITKIHRKYETLEETKKVSNDINRDYCNHVVSYVLPNSKAVEVISAETNKAKAIEIIAKLENVEKEQIYTIGDSYNDIEMLKEFKGNCMEISEVEIYDICEKKYKSVSDLIIELENEM